MGQREKWDKSPQASKVWNVPQSVKRHSELSDNDKKGFAKRRSLFVYL